MARLHLTLVVVALLVTHLTLPALAQDKVASAEEAKQAEEAKLAEEVKAEESEKLTPEEQEKLKQQQEAEAAQLGQNVRGGTPSSCTCPTTRLHHNTEMCFCW